jgi:hypothetical protein
VLLGARLSPLVQLDVGGALRPMLFTHRRLLLIEELTGINTLERVDLGELSARSIAIFITCAIGDENIGSRDVGRHINIRTIRQYRDALADAWKASMPEPRPARKKNEAPSKISFSWLKAWAEARADLDLGDEEWLDMTPRQVDALYRVRSRQRRRENILIGKLGAAIVNWSGRAKAPVTPEAFLGMDLSDEDQEAMDGPLTGEMIMAALAGFPKSK